MAASGSSQQVPISHPLVRQGNQRPRWSTRGSDHVGTDKVVDLRPYRTGVRGEAEDGQRRAGLRASPPRPGSPVDGPSSKHRGPARCEACTKIRDSGLVWLFDSEQAVPSPGPSRLLPHSAPQRGRSAPHPPHPGPRRLREARPAHDVDAPPDRRRRLPVPAAPHRLGRHRPPGPRRHGRVLRAVRQPAWPLDRRRPGRAQCGRGHHTRRGRHGRGHGLPLRPRPRPSLRRPARSRLPVLHPGRRANRDRHRQAPGRDGRTRAADRNQHDHPSRAGQANPCRGRGL